MIHEFSSTGKYPSAGAGRAHAHDGEGGFTPNRSAPFWRRHPGVTFPALVVLLSVCCLAWGTAGCGTLGAGFVDLFDPSGALAVIDDSPGYVVVAFVNNAVVDERLIAYLESAGGGGLVLTDAQKRALRPRVRLRMLVSFTDGTSRVIEFIDGSSELVDPRFDVQALPDLNENDLTNAVVVCDVAGVEIEPGTDIEVFLPVELLEFELVEVQQADSGAVEVVPEITERFPPQFSQLLVDDLDQDGNVTLQRNIGIRDVPSPVGNPFCGSVITVVMTGVLSVPFLDGVSDAPSFDVDDASTVAGIGGRYEFVVAVR